MAKGGGACVCVYIENQDKEDKSHLSGKERERHNNQQQSTK